MLYPNLTHNVRHQRHISSANASVHSGPAVPTSANIRKDFSNRLHQNCIAFVYWFSRRSVVNNKELNCLWAVNSAMSVFILTSDYYKTIKHGLIECYKCCLLTMEYQSFSFVQLLIREADVSVQHFGCFEPHTKRQQKEAQNLCSLKLRLSRWTCL